MCKRERENRVSECARERERIERANARESK